MRALTVLRERFRLPLFPVTFAMTLLAWSAPVLSSETLTLNDEPCFSVRVEVREEYVVRVRSVAPDGAVQIHGSDPSVNVMAMVVSASVCGVGDWVFERQVGAECVEWNGEYRNITGRPCVWDDWEVIVTATVDESFAVPEAPTYFASLTQHLRMEQ